MARNGTGTYSLPAGNPVVTGTTISSTVHNTTLTDIASAITGSIAANGETPITANIPMHSFKFTGLAAGSGAGDSVRYEQFASPPAIGGTAPAAISCTTLTSSYTNTASTYQASISGSMTFDSASIAAQQINTTLTGGASTTNARGLLLNTTFTPTANATIANVYNQFSLNSGVSPTNVYAQANIAILGAAALGGTVTNYYGQTCSFSPNASATTNITNWYSYHTSNIANGTAMTVTNAYGFVGAIASGSGRWNCYMSGTANNAFAGNVRFGGVTAPTVAVDVTGAVLATTSIKSSGATSGIGYATGAGGTVTQLTDKSTLVTLNKACGKITTHNANLNAGASVAFLVANSTIEATDVIVVNITSATIGVKYRLDYGVHSAGNAYVNITNVTAGNLAEAIDLNFAVFKAVTA